MMIDEQGLVDLRGTVKTIAGLREMLFDEIDRLRCKGTTSKEAATVARLAEVILQSARVEMDAYKHPLSDAFLKLPEYPSLDQ